MRKWQWAVVLSCALCVAVSMTSGPSSLSIRFSGSVTAGAGTCEQLSDQEIRCRMAAGETGVIELRAAVSIEEYSVSITGVDLPHWVELESVDGFGEVVTEAIISAPASAAGQTFILELVGSTDFDLQAELWVILEVLDAGSSSGNGSSAKDVRGGQETNQGIEFPLDFLPDVSAFVLGNVMDCTTGEPIAPSSLTTQFTFSPDATQPYEFTDLRTVIVRAPGYEDEVLTQFRQYTIPLFLFQVTFVTPTQPDICLVPIEPPSCSFSWSPQTPLAGTWVGFDAAGSEGIIEDYAWSFGDGTGGKSRVVWHQYDAPGTYSVKLTLTDGFGNLSSCDQTITVVPPPNEPPVCGFTWSPETPEVGEGIAFTSTSIDADGVIVGGTWDFGNGEVVEAEPSSSSTRYRYDARGNHVVTLTVTDDDGATSSCSETITVLASPNVPPICSFTWEPISTKAQELISFHNAATDPDGRIIWAEWDFGDDTGPQSAEGPHFDGHHTYAGPGTYTVQLRVMDDAKTIRNCPETITILPPACDFTWSEDPIEAKRPVTFRNEAGGPAGEGDSRHLVRWDFGDGSRSESNTDFNSSHVYESAGSYTVTMTTQYDDETTWSCSKVISVREPRLSIRLLNPLPGEGLRAPTEEPFCWEALGDPGLKYEVTTHKTECDPEVISSPHPFAQAFYVDPALSARKVALGAEKRALDEKFERLQASCGKRFPELFDRVEDRLSKVRSMLSELRKWKADAERAQAPKDGKAFALALPESCPRTVAETLAPVEGSFDDIDICGDDACRELVDRVNSAYVKLGSIGDDSDTEFGRATFLLDRWVKGADHRGVFEVYDAMMKWLEKAAKDVAFVISFIGKPAFDVALEKLIRKIIDSALTEYACHQAPEWCAEIRAAPSVTKMVKIIWQTLDAASKGSGGPAAGFALLMVEALAGAAGKATSAAVTGWTRWAAEMGEALWSTYSSLLCEEAALEWLLLQWEARVRSVDRHIDIPGPILRACTDCERCLTDAIAKVEEELQEIAEEEEAARAARVSFWEAQSAAIQTESLRAIATLDDAWFAACCSEKVQTISVPGESWCAQELEEALKSELGDKACFLRFAVGVSCVQTPATATTEARTLADIHVDFEYLEKRRVGCCVPSERSPSSQGTQSDPGHPGESVCLPREDNSSEPDPDGWGVEARNEDGELIGASPIRMLGDGETDDGVLPDPRVVSVRSCDCSVEARLDGVAVPPGSFGMAAQLGGPTAIEASGNCGPDCNSGAQLIIIHTPAMADARRANPFALAPLPIVVIAPTFVYDFPTEGVYEVSVAQYCEDGQLCSSTFDVQVADLAGPIPVVPIIENGQATVHTCPACGSDECLVLWYQRHGEVPRLPLQGHWLTLSAPGIVDLEVSSFCQSDCPGERHVAWEFCTPSGERIVFSDTNLYRIAYPFEDTGQYSLCVVETVSCPEGDLRFENWWEFRVQVQSEDGDSVGPDPILVLDDGADSTSTPQVMSVDSGADCPCSLSATVNGILVMPGGFVLTAEQGIQTDIVARWDCESSCEPEQASISIQPPASTHDPTWRASPAAPLPPPITVDGSTTAYDFPVEGIYEISMQHSCEAENECVYTFDVHVESPAPRIPAEFCTGGAATARGCPSCASDECIELAYARAGDPRRSPIPGKRANLGPPGVVNLEALSFCRLDCTEDRHVAWELCTPRGERIVFQDVDLYRISYHFKDVGDYSLCVVESVPCLEGDQRFENWWILEVGDP